MENSWEDVQGDVLAGLPRPVKAFLFLEIVDVRAFKAALGGSLARRATSARTAHEWSERGSLRGSGPQPTGLNVAFTAAGCAKLLPGGVPPDPAFLAGAQQRARLIGDPEPAVNWLPQLYGAAIDVVVLVAGSSLKAVDAEWKLLANLLGSSVRLCYRQDALRRDAAPETDHFGHATCGLDGNERPGLYFRSEHAAVDPAPLAWMKHGTYAVFRRAEHLVPEYFRFPQSRPAARERDVDVWRNSRVSWRVVPFGPEVSELERVEGKTTADRGSMFTSYHVAIRSFEDVQCRCASPNPFAINSGSAYAFVPSIAALARELAN